MTKGNKQTATDTEATAFVVNPEDLVIRKLMPGIVVSLTCHLRGGRRSYKQNHVVNERDDGSVHETWDAGRSFDNKPEFDAADALRQSVRRRIKSLGLDTAVGLIVPVVRQTELAKMLAHCRAEINAFNADAKTLDIVYRYALYESDSANKAAIAAISDQLEDVLQQVQKASLADEASILAHATAADLGEYKNAAAALKAPKDERRIIVARVRAKIARKAIKEAQSFSKAGILPEETGRAVSDLVKQIRSNAKAWVKASKEDDDAYEQALKAVPTEGISHMQAALVLAAKNADADVESETQAVAEGEGNLHLLGGSSNGEVAAPVSPFIGALAVDSKSTDVE
jgi:hypothetical protein